MKQVLKVLQITWWLYRGSTVRCIETTMLWKECELLFFSIRIDSQRTQWIFSAIFDYSYDWVLFQNWLTRLLGGKEATFIHYIIIMKCSPYFVYFLSSLILSSICGLSNANCGSVSVYGFQFHQRLEEIIHKLLSAYGFVSACSSIFSS